MINKHKMCDNLTHVVTVPLCLCSMFLVCYNLIIATFYILHITCITVHVEVTQIYIHVHVCIHSIITHVIST